MEAEEDPSSQVLRLIEGFRKYRGLQDSVTSAYAGLEGAYGRLKPPGNTAARAKVEKMLESLGEKEGAGTEGSSPWSLPVTCGSSVEDALRSENVCYKRLRLLEKEMSAIVSLLRRDFGGLLDRGEPVESKAHWELVSSAAEALDAVEKDLVLKRRIVASLNWETPEEDRFVYNTLLSLQPFLREGLFETVEAAAERRAQER